MAETLLEIRHLSKAFGKNVVLKDIVLSAHLQNLRLPYDTVFQYGHIVKQCRGGDAAADFCRATESFDERVFKSIYERVTV